MKSMTQAVHHSIETLREAVSPQRFNEQFISLELINKPNLTTAECAYYLNRSPQTLRVWACKSGTGPLVPRRIMGILAWSTSEVKALAGATP
jgi:hypothetical protein